MLAANYVKRAVKDLPADWETELWVNDLEDLLKSEAAAMIAAIREKVATRTETYVYMTLSRPAMYGTAPEGFLLNASPRDETGVDEIAYTRQLTVEEIKKYELVPVTPNAYPFSTGQKVVVNGIDDAVIVAFPQFKARPGFVLVLYQFKDETGFNDLVHWLDIKVKP
jgi:hypothetical protein